MFHIVTAKLSYLADEINNIQFNHSYVNIGNEQSKKKKDKSWWNKQTRHYNYQVQLMRPTNFLDQKLIGEVYINMLSPTGAHSGHALGN